MTEMDSAAGNETFRSMQDMHQTQTVVSPSSTSSRGKPDSEVTRHVDSLCDPDNESASAQRMSEPGVSVPEDLLTGPDRDPPPKRAPAKRQTATNQKLEGALTLLRSVGPQEWQTMHKPRLIFEAAHVIRKLDKRVSFLEARDMLNNNCIQKLVNQCSAHAPWEPGLDLPYIRSTPASPQMTQYQNGPGYPPDTPQQCIEPSLIHMQSGPQEAKLKEAVNYFFNTTVDQSYVKPIDVINNGIGRWTFTRTSNPSHVRIDQHMGLGRSAPMSSPANPSPYARTPLQKHDSNAQLTSSGLLPLFDQLGSTPLHLHHDMARPHGTVSSPPTEIITPSLPVERLLAPKKAVSSAPSPGKENKGGGKRARKTPRTPATSIRST